MDLVGVGTVMVGVGAIITAATAPLHKKLNRVDKAVNRVGPGEKPLTERVNEGFQKLDQRMEDLGSNLDEHKIQDGENFASLDASFQSVVDTAGLRRKSDKVSRRPRTTS